MPDWTTAPIFGIPDPTLPLHVRPSAYGVVCNSDGQIALVRTPRGVYLPGGGSDPGEPVEVTVQRESREEIGLHVAIGTWRRVAIEHVAAASEGASFEKRSTFCDAVPRGPTGLALELSHGIVWYVPEDAVAHLTPASHRWAVSEWIAAHTS
jgi:8-oxo-dGTP pyrophosphatase MutT (NUDIX family)